MRIGLGQSFSTSEFVTGRLAQKPPQPSKPQSHSSLSGLEDSSGDGGAGDELDGGVDPSSEDDEPITVEPEGEKSHCAAMFLKWSWM